MDGRSTSTGRAAAPGSPRRQAAQARSRATVERILAAAAAVIAERGPDLATMTEIARRAGVAMPSLYQYFPDKRGVMAALFERHAEDVRSALTRSLAEVASLEALVECFAGLSRRYFEQHREDPVVRSLWAAVQVDPELQALDAADSLRNARLLYDIARPFYGEIDEARLLTACALSMQLCAAAARFSLALPPKLAAVAPDVYADMVVRHLLALKEPRRP